MLYQYHQCSYDDSDAKGHKKNYKKHREDKGNRAMSTKIIALLEMIEDETI